MTTLTPERIEEIRKRLEAVAAHYGLRWAYESCGEKGDGSDVIGIMFHPDDEDAKNPLVGFCEPIYNEATHEFRDYYRDEVIAEIEHRNRAPGKIAEFVSHAPQDISDFLSAYDTFSTRESAMREALVKARARIVRLSDAAGPGWVSGETLSIIDQALSI